MVERADVITIESPPSAETGQVKRKADASSEELSLPCKKAALSATQRDNIGAESVAPASSTQQVKLTKPERDALKLEKAKERELERQKREIERQKRDKERLKREEERLKKVITLSCKANL